MKNINLSFLNLALNHEKMEQITDQRKEFLK